MSGQNKKPYYQSCTFWIGVLIVLFLVLESASVWLSGYRAYKEKQAEQNQQQQK